MKTVSKPDLNVVTNALRYSELFQSLDDGALGTVAKLATIVRFDSGEVIVREGDDSDALYLLLKGTATVQIDPKQMGSPNTIAHLKPPDIVGEIGLILDEPRTATVCTTDQLLALRFPRATFAEMFKRVPGFGMAVSRFLAARLVRASQQIHLEPADTEITPDPDLLQRIPLALLERHRVLPLAIADGALKFGFVFDPNPQVMEAVRRFFPGLVIHPVRIPADLVDRTVRSLAGTTIEEAPAAPEKSAPVGHFQGTPSEKKALLDRLLGRVVAEGASDLHLAAGHRPRWRIDGEMGEVRDAARLSENDAFEMLAPILNESQIANFDALAEVDLAYGLPGVARFRVNLYRDTNGACAVLRQIPEKVLTIEQLGLPPVIQKLCEHPKGLVLVTGPTGSGKSTTLAAMIDYLNHTRKSHILTLEDPIEFLHKSDQALVNQREVGAHTKSFDRALRAALREDPDIVLVGEMRDLETISLALETANTGHLVFATLHTSTAVSTIDRIVNMYPAEQQPQIRATLSDILRGVISQALCRRIGGGRVAALEILVANAAVANLIREGKMHQVATIMVTGQGIGNSLLNQSLEKLVTSRTIEVDEALHHAIDKRDLEKRLELAKLL